MKKTLSILMSVLIIALSLSMVSSAALYECDCEDHVAENCKCCVYCPNLDTHYLTSCVVNPDGTLKYKNPEAPEGEREVAFCCGRCTGIIPCKCGCSCCTLSEEDIENMNPDQIFDENQQEQIITGFQKVLNRFREFFDNFFEMIFEFLRIDDILGGNNNG